MGTVLLLIAVALLVYAIAIKPRQVASIIDTRLSAGDQVHDPVHCQDIVELLQGADWIRDKKDVKLVNNDKIGDPQLVEIACKGVTYQIRITPDGKETSKLTVSTVFKSDSWDIEKVRCVQEANRIRCRIMEQVDPGFAEQSQEYYGIIKTMYLLRYCAIAVIAGVLCRVAIPEILNRILGPDSISDLHILGMAIVVLLFVGFGVALSPYITVTRSEKLLDGFFVPQYLDNEALMELLRDKLHIKTMDSLYFDESGTVALKGKYATYLIEISPKRPRLSVVIQESDAAEAYQEANYIQCSIMKLFNSAHPENPEKMYTMLMTIRRGNLLKVISALAFVVLLDAPFLTNYFGSKGVANSYLTQYSETVTVGDAFEAFFGDPKWENYKVGAQEYVDFTGKCTYMNENATMRITFAVFDDTFNVTNITVNGIDMSALLWPGFLEAIYSGAEDALTATNVPDRIEPTADVSEPENSSQVGNEFTNPPIEYTGELDDFIGTWEDENGYGYYLFIGYGDESKSQAYIAVATATDTFEAELVLTDIGQANGLVMGGGSEPLYAIDLSRNNYWLETMIYYGKNSLSEEIKFVPADPYTCPYTNPYYTG